jgi:hypothetical protein
LVIEVAQAVAASFDVQDVAGVEQSVEDGRGDGLVASKHLGPVADALVRGDENGSALAAVGLLAREWFKADLDLRRRVGLGASQLDILARVRALDDLCLGLNRDLVIWIATSVGLEPLAPAWDGSCLTKPRDPKAVAALEMQACWRSAPPPDGSMRRLRSARLQRTLARSPNRDRTRPGASVGGRRR